LARCTTIFRRRKPAEFAAGINCDAVGKKKEELKEKSALNDRGTQIAYARVDWGRLSEFPASALRPVEIHVWQFSLEAAEPAAGSFMEQLSEEEQQRTARFHFEVDRRRFAVARARVRSLLARYTQTPAHLLNFAYSLQGKPSLANRAIDLRFNVSHSGELGLLAVTLGREIGADIEAMRANVETDKLAERFFSPHERGALRALKPEQRARAFYRCWTCKEAFLKAQGVGLGRNLDSFDVEVNPQLPAHLIETRPDADEARRWFLHDVETAPGYAAAVATEGPTRAITVFHCG